MCDLWECLAGVGREDRQRAPHAPVLLSVCCVLCVWPCSPSCLQLDDGKRVRKVPIVIEGGRGPHLLPLVEDPVLAQLNLCQHVGVVSERFQDALESYVKRNPHSVLLEDDTEGEANVREHVCV